MTGYASPRRAPTDGRDLIGLCLFGLVVAVVVATGIGIRASYGAQTTGDEPQYLLSALSLGEDRSLDISDELESERFRDFHEADLPQQTLLLDDGRRISPHDPLLPLLLALPFGLGGWAGAKAAVAIMAGGLAALTVWTAVRRFGVSTSTAYLVTGVFVLSPPLAVYSTQLYPEIPAALVTMVGLAALQGSLDRRGRIVLAAAVIALPWLAVKFVPIAAVLAIAGVIRTRPGRRLGLAASFALAGVAYLIAHLAIYGGLTAYASGDHFVGGEFSAVGTDVDLWGRSTRLIGLLVDRGFGIGAWQPAFLLLPLVSSWALSRRRRDLAIPFSLLAAGWLVATFVALTMHGWWFPGRQLVVVLPMAVLLVAAWVDQQSASRRWVLLPLGALGIAAFGFLVLEGIQGRLTWVVDFGATGNPFYQALTPILPDYMAPTISTWALHALWVSAAAGLTWLGWRSRPIERALPPTAGLDREMSRERVMT